MEPPQLQNHAQMLPTPADQSTNGPCASLSSCPDEVLKHIISFLGPYLATYRRQVYWNIYELDVRSLRQLALVNKRLHRLAEAELYRVPHTVFPPSGSYLTSEYVNIYPKAAVHAEALWLLGSAQFFTRLFSMGFQSLTSLDLLFGIPGRGHSERCGSFDMTNPRSMTRLAAMIQGMQLRFLKIKYQEVVLMDRQDITTGVQLAAGHATLRDFIWIGPGSPDESSTTVLPLLASVKSIRNLRSFRCENVFTRDLSWIFAALGDMPALNDLTLGQFHNSDILQAIPDVLARQLAELQIFDNFRNPLPLSRLENLTRFEGLQVLALGDLLQNVDEDALDRICLPQLRHLESTSELAFRTNTALFRWAQKTALLPMLRILHVRREGTGASLDWPAMVECAVMVSVLDELLAARQDLQLEPAKIRQRMEKRLTRYRAFRQDDETA